MTEKSEEDKKKCTALEGASLCMGTIGDMEGCMKSVLFGLAVVNLLDSDTGGVVARKLKNYLDSSLKDLERFENLFKSIQEERNAAEAAKQN